MKKSFEKAGLSNINTNHCLCATSITELNRSGFEALHIMSISGHQSESSKGVICLILMIGIK